MKMKVVIWCVMIPLLVMSSTAWAGQGFDVVALGVRGGIDDGNLSAWLIHPHGDERALTCDAGTLVNGLRVAARAGAFASGAGTEEGGEVGALLTGRVRAYLISHAHLDHLAGLLIAAPDDNAKPIYALPSVNERIARNYLNWEAWPNFGDRGPAPRLGKYHLQDMTAGFPLPIVGTAMTATAFPLSHGGVESTAFLIESGGGALLCLGDTGPDEVEKSNRLHELWAAVAPMVRQHRLKAIIIEASYPDAQPDDRLFGHLTPAWLLKSLHDLDRAAGGKGVLSGLPVIISHIKYRLGRDNEPAGRIQAELEQGNDLGLRFIIPRQGQSWNFD